MNATDTSLAGDSISESAVVATVCGLISAVGYTAANIFLRSVSDCDPTWVSTIKAVPVVVLFGPWLIFQRLRGQRVLPRGRVLLMLAAAALLGQLAGNVLFQWALGIIGIALTVPLTLGTIILTGAIMGRLFLHEPLTMRIALSVFVLILAIFILSLGAGDAHRSVTEQPVADILEIDLWLLARGVGAAMVAGCAYSILGVVIRYGVTGRASLSMTMFVVGIVGLSSLGGLSLWQIGWSGMLQTDRTDLGLMILAGVWNAVAFLALTKALQISTVVYVNALNATQATMAAVAGVIFFQEALSPQLAWGVLLTIAGLLLMKSRKAPVR